MALVGLARKFKREYSYAELTKKCTFFDQNLKSMIDEGEMFAGIRESALDFYYRGRRAMRRTKGVYKINKYYIDGVKNGGSPEVSFTSDNIGFDFSKMLKFCKKKADKEKESAQIAKLYKYFSFLSEHSEAGSPQLVDIEARFSSLEDDATDQENDRIDLVFFMPKQKALMFVEVKRRLDGRIRAKEGNTPEVVGQVDSYRKQLQVRQGEISDAYKNVSKIMKDIFGRSFAVPETIKVISVVPILVVDDPRKDTTGNLLSKHTKDTWLEPSLAGLGNEKVWDKDGVKLIDGRRIFSGAVVQQDELAKILEDIALGDQ